MSQYIKADALIKFIDNRFDITWEHDYEGGIKDACMDILEEINKQPIADVRENVHGNWELAEDGWFCTSCEMYAPFDCDPEEKGIPFCPWCGADMRKEDI